MTLREQALRGVAGALCGLLGWLGLTSCGATSSMKVGVVNTGRIVAEHPDYQAISVEWMKRREEMGAMVPDDPASLTLEQRRALQARLEKEAAEKSGQMDKLVREFMQRIQADIQQSAEQVAGEKGLDAVIIESPGFSTVLYNSGENITTDILLKLRKK